MKLDFGLSIVIPTLNEYHHIQGLLDCLTKHKNHQNLDIIVVDGGSTDGTLDVVLSYSAVLLVQSDIAARPNQMNLGAKHSKYDWLYFVHADIKLPESFYEDIQNASKSYLVGGYRYRFDSNHLLLKINAFFTRFPMMWCRGGDQTLFIKRKLFEELDGYDEYFSVMEDFDIIRRAKRKTRYFIIPKNVIVSARKYQSNSYFKVQLINLRAFRMFRKGKSPSVIRAYYKQALGLKDY